MPLSWSACALAVQWSAAKLPLAAFGTFIGLWIRDLIHGDPNDYTMVVCAIYGVGLAETLFCGWLMRCLRVPLWVYGFVGLFALADLMFGLPLLFTGMGLYMTGILSLVIVGVVHLMRYLRHSATPTESHSSS